MGVGTICTGLFGVLAGVIAMLLLAARAPREAPVGGMAIGLGSTWLLLFIRAAMSCDVDCVRPDLRPWFGLAGAFIAIGVTLSARASQRRRAVG